MRQQSLKTRSVAALCLKFFSHAIREMRHDQVLAWSGRRSAELTSAAPTLGGGGDNANQAIASAYSRRVGETADWLGTAKIALQVSKL